MLGAIQRGMIPPGSLIVADEGSMISLTHLAAIAEYAPQQVQAHPGRGPGQSPPSKAAAP